MEGVIDKFADDIQSAASQPKPPNPQQVEAEAKLKSQESEQAHSERMRQSDERLKAMDVEIKRFDLVGAGMELQQDAANGETKIIDKADRAHAEAMDAIGKLAQLMTLQGTTLTDSMRQLGTLIAAPNELIRDEAGRPVGSRKIVPPEVTVN